MKYSVENWWSHTDRGKPKYSEENLFQCHFSYYKSHMDYSGIEEGPHLYGAGA